MEQNWNEQASCFRSVNGSKKLGGQRFSQKLIIAVEQLIVISFYRFLDLRPFKRELAKELEDLHGLKGVIILSDEGINGMAAGERRHIERFKAVLEDYPGLNSLDIKESFSPKNPFPKWRVRLKEQTIRYTPGFAPTEASDHISPKEWHRLLNGDEPVTILDTRNKYETKLGKFEGAIDPDIQNFTDFSEYLDECDLPKEQTTLIYCTGGIRCEKAIVDMRARGFQKVRQLHGGILRYLEAYPNQKFEGECFVFDQRVSIDQNLQPSEIYRICPHCGDPGTLAIDCSECGRSTTLCEDCETKASTCSKNCEYQKGFRASQKTQV